MAIAIITGVSSELGREFALLAQKRKHVDAIWLIARRTERLEELAEKHVFIYYKV